MKKRRQHYVWQEYLKPWESDGKIWCRREGKIFPTNTLNIGHQRDFYRLKELSHEEIEFVRKVAVKPSKGLLRDANEGWISTLQEIFKIRNYLIEKRLSSDEIDNQIDICINNLEEDLHGHIETESIHHLHSLLSGDISFFSRKEGRMEFSHYLCLQYMRTRRIQESFCSSFADLSVLKTINPENCWSIMRHIYATNMASVLINNPEKFRMILVRNQTETHFISGDQPVINTYAIDSFGKEMPTDTEFYYPISPFISLLISAKKEYVGIKEITVSREQAMFYNSAIVDISLEQIYSDSRELLELFP